MISVDSVDSSDASIPSFTMAREHDFRGFSLVEYKSVSVSSLRKIPGTWTDFPLICVCD